MLVFSSSIISNSLNPQWDEDYRIEVCHFAEVLVFEVRDKDHAYAEFIGSVTFPTRALLAEEAMVGHYPIMKKNGNASKGTLELKVQVKEKTQFWKKIIKNS